MWNKWSKCCFFALLSVSAFSLCIPRLVLALPRNFSLRLCFLLLLRVSFFGDLKLVHRSSGDMRLQQEKKGAGASMQGSAGEAGASFVCDNVGHFAVTAAVESNKLYTVCKFSRLSNLFNDALTHLKFNYISI